MAETLLALMQATREDVAALRREQSSGREQQAQLAAQMAAVSAQVAAVVANLEQHRADDRRELDQLHQRTDRLTARERWLAGGLATVGAVAAAAGWPVAARLLDTIGG